MYNWSHPSLYTTLVVYSGCLIIHYYFKWMAYNMWNACYHTQLEILVHTCIASRRPSTTHIRHVLTYTESFNASSKLVSWRFSHMTSTIFLLYKLYYVWCTLVDFTFIHQFFIQDYSTWYWPIMSLKQKLHSHVLRASPVLPSMQIHVVYHLGFWIHKSHIFLHVL